MTDLVLNPHLHRLTSLRPDRRQNFRRHRRRRSSYPTST
jgi:hypothetical protein